jgi:hypothetical protein
MITLKDYLMGRDKDFPLDMQQARNAADLLSRVNYLFGRLNLKAAVSSGYRPSSINKTIGGAKLSTHTVCAGIDLVDPFGKIGILLTKRTDLLQEFGLWLENPLYTIKHNQNGPKTHWVHLDIKERKNRIFNP